MEWRVKRRLVFSNETHDDNFRGFRAKRKGFVRLEPIVLVEASELGGRPRGAMIGEAIPVFVITTKRLSSRPSVFGAVYAGRAHRTAKKGAFSLRPFALSETTCNGLEV
jgi:hypothetical protein